MKILKNNSPNGYMQLLLIALLAAGSMTAALLFALPITTTPQASMSISPTEATVELGDTLVVKVVVSAEVPVNAFTGEVVFDSGVFSVDKIEYDTSIANLWVTEPWYSKSDNSIYFAGGDTTPGGFTGRGTLMTIYLTAKNPGFVSLSLLEAKVLQHDGFGTEATLDTGADFLFTAERIASETNVAEGKINEMWVQVDTASPSADLNQDGIVTLADLSILTVNFGSTKKQYDLNQNGRVGFGDLSILLNAL